MNLYKANTLKFDSEVPSIADCEKEKKHLILLFGIILSILIPFFVEKNEQSFT